MKKTSAFLTAFLILMSFMLSCAYSPKPKDDRVVLEVSGEKIYYDYFRYVFLNSKRDMDDGDESYWTENADKLEVLKNTVLETIVHNRAIQLLADKHGIKLTDDEKQEIADYVKSMKKSDEGFESEMESAYLTEYSFYYIQTFTELWGKAYDHITSDVSGIIKSDDATVRADIPKKFRRVRYIMLEIDEDNKEQSRQNIDYILSKAKAGESFTELVKNYCEDSNMVSSASDGYYYTVGQLQPEFEAAVDAIEIGEISEVVETSGYYFIIQRLDIDNAYVENNFSDFITMYKARVFNEMVAELEKTVTVKTSELWDNIKLNDIK